MSFCFRFLKGLFVVGVVAFNLTIAHAVVSTIDFESGSCSPSVTSGYLRIVNSRGTICTQSGDGINSVSSGSRFSNDVQNLVVTHILGSTFTPLSMDIGEYSLSVDPPNPLIVKGYFLDNSYTTFSVQLDGVRDGPGGVEDFQTIIFPDSFANVVRLEFGPGFWSLDNLIAETPETAPPQEETDLTGNSIIDFEISEFCSDSVIQGDLKLTNSRGTICISSGTGSNSVSNGSEFSNDVQNSVITQTYGLPFTPIAMDVGEYSLSVTPPNPLLITGYHIDGTQVQLAFTLDGVCDGPGGVEDFQTVVFPDEFANVVRLEFGPGSWSLDNFIANTPHLPDPTIKTPKGSFISAERLIPLLSLEAPNYYPLVVLDNYIYQRLPTTITDLIYTKDSEITVQHLSPARDIVDPVSLESYQNSHNSINLLSLDGNSTPAFDLDTLFGLGYTLDYLKIYNAYNHELFFGGFDLSNGDQYYLFLYNEGVISPVVTPETSLPTTDGQSALPYYFPDHATTGAGGIAFDTSTQDDPSTSVVFERPKGSTTFRRIIAENDQTSFGRINTIDSLSYHGNDLIVKASASGSSIQIVFRDGVMISAANATSYRKIAGEGIRYRNAMDTRDPALRFASDNNAIYQIHNDLLHRVIGPDDKVNGEKITSAQYVSTSLQDSIHILAHLSFGNSSLNGLYELNIGTPLTPRIEMGTPLHWGKDDLELMYFPVNYATYGNIYTLYSSSDLVAWKQEQEITNTRDNPLGFVVGLQGKGSKLFFKVEEQQ